MSLKLDLSTHSGQGTPLRCSCGSTFAEVREDGALVIVSRHHGHSCANVLTADQLARLVQEATKKTRPPDG